MKFLLAVVTTVCMSLACSTEPDLTTSKGIEAESMSIVDQIADLCNGDMNVISGVSCDMSIENWTMDLTLPAGDVLVMEFEQLAELFCKIGDIVGMEPKITLNGMSRACGGIEV